MNRVLHVSPQIAVLDACVLVPPALRDLLLSCASVGIFRPVWQDEILDEVRRNSIRLLVDRKQLAQETAEAAVRHTLTQMARAFPDDEPSRRIDRREAGPVHARPACCLT